MSTRGENEKTYALYEELGHLRVAPGVGCVSIHKRIDAHLSQPLEKRAWQIRIPVPNTPGIRKSLRTPDREIALQKAEKMTLVYKTGKISIQER